MDYRMYGPISRELIEIVYFLLDGAAGGEELNVDQRIDLAYKLKPLVERVVMMESAVIPFHLREPLRHVPPKHDADVIPLVPRHPHQPAGLPPKGAA